MLQVQTPLAALPHVEHYERIELNNSLPKTSTGMPVGCQYNSSNWVLGNPLATHRMPKHTAFLQASGDTSSGNARLEEYIAELLTRAHGMAISANLPQRKSVNELLSEYIQALSTKKATILELATAQVACEEAEAELLEVYTSARLIEFRNAYCTTDDSKSATGRYFDAVSDVRFDPLEM